MAVASINPCKLVGKWKSGWALDYHTIKSTLVGLTGSGHPQFETDRTELGELLYQLKNKGLKEAAQPIIDTVVERVLAPQRDKVDLIVPAPPSKWRAVQPVLFLAEGIGEAVGLPVVPCVKATRLRAQIKDVADPKERKVLMNGLYQVDPAPTEGKRVLLFDDLYRSGTTLNAITDVLLTQGRAGSVSVLTVTRTRRNR